MPTQNPIDFRADESARDIIALLKVYRHRLVHMLEDWSKAHESPPRSRQVALHRFESGVLALWPVLPDLIRQASQLIEHGDLPPVRRIELRLRLADLEASARAISLAANVQWPPQTLRAVS